MAWIKRNLYFLIGSIIALGLMVFGVIVLLSQMSRENAAAEEIQKQYAELTRLNGGTASTENIDAAKKQEAELRKYIGKARGFFQRIPPIPNFTTNRVSNADFAAELRNTISQLTNSASKMSVDLPPDYYFSFEAQKKLMIFDPTNLDSMAVHLGEIKAICDILFEAKINNLIGIRREVVSESTDLNPPDYITDKTISTPLAEMTPYEVTFKSFSAELAEVLAGLASSTNAYIVKSINVEPSGVGGLADETGGMNPNPTPPAYVPPPRPYYPGRGEGGRPYYPPPQQYAPPPVANRGPQGFLTEKPFRVTLDIMVVKPKGGR